MTMLYDRWRETARSHPDELALADCRTGSRWTFSQLAAAAEKIPQPAAPIVHPQGNDADFILSLLSAWHHGLPACPLEPGQSPPPLTPSIPAGIVHLKTTSATTGPPRLLAFTAAQLAADASNIVATMGLRPEWPNLATISLAHSYGFSNLILPLLLHGIPLILLDTPLPERLRRAILDHGQLTLPAVPALWRLWHENEILSPSLRLAISAGAPLPLELEKSIFSETGVKLHNFYGSTECGGIAYDRTSTPRLDPALVGTALQGVTLRTDSENRLIVRSPAVAQTAWPIPDDSVTNGQFLTHDLVELRDQQVFLRGRLTDQINLAGRKLSPETVERPLSQHPAVVECLVFGTPAPDNSRADTIVACVVLRRAATAETLRQFLLTQLPAWQIPRTWWFVDSLAPNHRGKLSRPEWRQRFLERPAP